MTNQIETKYAIGDLVYLASERSVDREVIKAIKVVGLKKAISYGTKAPARDWFSVLYGQGDGYNWYKATDIFDTQEEAEKRQADLQAKAEAKAEQDRLKEIAEMEDQLARDKENLRRKKLGLEPLEEDEQDD